jgi:hypothetical protein
MRMPLLSYFLLMSFILSLALLFVSSQLEPAPVPTSQIMGLRKPPPSEPELPSYQVTATNFASPPKTPTDALAKAEEDAKPVRTVKSPRTQKNDALKSSRSVGKSVADYPLSVMLAIH